MVCKLQTCILQKHLEENAKYKEINWFLEKLYSSFKWNVLGVSTSGFTYLSGRKKDCEL